MLTVSFTSNFKLVLGHQTGALAIAVANPTDLVKVRLQAEGNLLPGVPKRYSGALNAYYTIFKQVCIFFGNLGPSKSVELSHTFLV